MIHSQLYSLAILSFLIAAAGSDPDFRGNWNLNTERSNIQQPPCPPAHRITVKQHGEGTRYSLEVQDDEPSMLWHVSVDGHESRDRIADGTMSTMAKWEGAALLINSIVTGRSRSYTRMDRWQVSGNGETLTIHRSVVDRSGEIESVLVYERR